MLMRSQQLDHKPFMKREAKRKRSSGHEAIVAFQHMLLWSSIYVLASEVYMLALGAITSELLASSVLLLTSSAVAMIHIICHMTVSIISGRPQTSHVNDRLIISQWLAKLSLRVGVTLWMVACGLNIVFTIARQPHCVPKDGATRSSLIHAGKLCVVQRTGVGASLLAMRLTNVRLAAGALFALLQKTSEPFRANLFGIMKDFDSLPHLLSYAPSTDRAMFSEMSFKCRSSSSLSSSDSILTPNRSTTHLLPSCPEQAVIGLGIYSCKNSRPSFLTPRPSLCSIRTHTTVRSRSSPLPPLPPYFPDACRRNTTVPKTAVPPQRPPRPYSYSALQGKTVRMVPPSPALLSPNPVALKRSEESLSSMYSRSISGESRRASATRPALLRENGRAYSSSSTMTVVKSPLGAMCVAGDFIEVISTARRPKKDASSRDGRAEDDGGDSDIDDAATLQARLPLAKSHALLRQRDSYYERPREKDEDGTERRLTFTPLSVKKTRDSAAMFSTRHVESAF
ncbi:hypothetical protein D0861_06777 [Hortaea werneckii]|uniref:Uncharacterized protein n=1 Tax=Hortaea werneckii TaxID=91943 RepID=A0A3M7F886_HORWE|nr:hypothetical protein D0861_06777 [Hortaea werneckii]